MTIRPAGFCFASGLWPVARLLVAGTPLQAAEETALAAPAFTNADCLECYTDPTLTKTRQGREVPMAAVDTNLFLRSVHGTLDCTDCHAGLKPEHDPGPPPATCGDCHEAATRDYQKSIHGWALLKMGLIVAPSCNNCHGVHDIKRSLDEGSPISHARISRTCGKCHVKVEAIYARSIHGQVLARGEGIGPVCTDCHTAHEIEPPAAGHFKKVSDQRCGRCHQDRLQRYHETYHGKAMELGTARGGGRGRLLRRPRAS